MATECNIVALETFATADALNYGAVADIK